jgi:hypothetical protein
MGLFNVLGSLKKLESAASTGDDYPVKSSLLINGLGTIAAAVLGSCFPTTIYICHPGWKRMGAWIGYSWLNGVVSGLGCLLGLFGVLGQLIPIEAGMAIVLYLALVIAAQAFQATPRSTPPPWHWACFRAWRAGDRCCLRRACGQGAPAPRPNPSARPCCPPWSNQFQCMATVGPPAGDWGGAGDGHRHGGDGSEPRWWPAV